MQGDPRLARAGHHDRQQNDGVRLSLRELATLQTFPEDFAFAGSVEDQHRQVGNAVPPLLAEHLGHAIWRALGPPRSS